MAKEIGTNCLGYQPVELRVDVKTVVGERESGVIEGSQYTKSRPLLYFLSEADCLNLIVNAHLISQLALHVPGTPVHLVLHFQIFPLIIQRSRFQVSTLDEHSFTTSTS